MRIFAKVHHIGGDIKEISLSPYKANCVFLDLKEGKSYKISENWEIWNGAKFLGKYLYDIGGKDKYHLPCDLEEFDSPVVKVEGSIVELANGRIINGDDENYGPRGLTFVNEYIWYRNGEPENKFLRVCYDLNICKI